MTEVSDVGTARDALAVPEFRRLFIASFISNTGRWMQMVAVGVLGWELTESSTYLGLLVFAQLVPLSFLSLIGGSLADSANRRTLLLATQVWQMAWTLVLALMLLDGDIGRNALLLIIFVIGLGQGLYAPAFTSLLPTLAQSKNLQAAISLNSMQGNGARIIGPAIGGWMTSQFGFAEVFAINGLAYLFVIAALINTPMAIPIAKARTFADRIFGGFRIANRAPQVGRPILLMMSFALLCLPFVGQLPALAELHLGVDSRSTEYGWFYAAFGGGALVGAALVGTVFLRAPAAPVARICLVGFALSLAWLSTLEQIEIAIVAIALVGLFYFALPTILMTIWQTHVEESVRGRVAALWVLSWGGMVPIANVIAGPVVEATSLRAVMLAGSAAAIALGLRFRLPDGPVVGEEILDRIDVTSSVHGRSLRRLGQEGLPHL